MPDKKISGFTCQHCGRKFKSGLTHEFFDKYGTYCPICNTARLHEKHKKEGGEHVGQ